MISVLKLLHFRVTRILDLLILFHSLVDTGYSENFALAIVFKSLDSPFLGTRLRVVAH